MSYYHDIPRGIKKQTPTGKKTYRKAKRQSFTKHAKAQLRRELGKSQGPPQAEKAAEACVVCRGQLKAGLALQPKHPNVS